MNFLPNSIIINPHVNLTMTGNALTSRTWLFVELLHGEHFTYPNGFHRPKLYWAALLPGFEPLIKIRPTLYCGDKM